LESRHWQIADYQSFPERLILHRLIDLDRLARRKAIARLLFLLKSSALSRISNGSDPVIFIAV